MKTFLILVLIFAMSGCATKGDVSNISTQIAEIHSENVEIKNNLIESEGATNVAQIKYDSAIQYNMKAEKHWEEILKKLDKISKK